MSTFAYPGQAVRDAEVPLLESGVPLMARAAAALAGFASDSLRERRGQTAGSRVCVLAGPGNNAGDALFAAATLGRRGARVTVITLFERTHAEGFAAVRRSGAESIALTGDDDAAARAALTELSRSDLVLDGILGTGGRRGLPRHVTRLIRDWRAEEPAAVVIAVDIPSDLASDQLDVHAPGTDAEDFAGSECRSPSADARIRADATLTFGGLKSALVDPRTADFTGPVHLVDIGLELDPADAVAELLETADLRAGFPRPDRTSHKYSRGVLGVVAGSRAFPGAGRLATGAAVNAAAGMVRFLGSREVGSRVLDRHPEAVLAPGRIDALVIGSGDPESSVIEAGFAALAESAAPLLLDAGALEMVGHAEADPLPGSAGRLRDRTVLLTPHAGELSRLLSRLLGEIITARRVAADPLPWARRAASATGHIVLLKGAQTVIACPDGFAVLPEPGPASLASAGSGDVLTGIIGTLLAAGQAARRTAGEEEPMPWREAARAAGLGVLLHNAAGRRAISADQLVAAVGVVTNALIHGAESATGILVQ